MKLGAVLLVNLVCVAGGIFVYDAFRSEGTPSADFADLDRPSGPPAGTGPGGSASLDSGTTDALVRSNARRLTAIEETLDALRKDAGRERAEHMAGAAGGGLTGLTSSAFDERTLEAISDYVEEINRRKGDERRREQIGRDFERRGVVLTDDERSAVLDALIRFQREVMDLRGKHDPRNPSAVRDMVQAQRALQEALQTKIRDLVPEAQAEKILQIDTGRGMPSTGIVRRDEDGD